MPHPRTHYFRKVIVSCREGSIKSSLMYIYWLPFEQIKKRESDYLLSKFLLKNKKKEDRKKKKKTNKQDSFLFEQKPTLSKSHCLFLITFFLKKRITKKCEISCLCFLIKKTQKKKQKTKENQRDVLAAPLRRWSFVLRHMQPMDLCFCPFMKS